MKKNPSLKTGPLFFLAGVLLLAFAVLLLRPWLFPKDPEKIMQDQVHSFYERQADNRPLQSSLHFKVVDDFNGRNASHFKQLGWHMREPATGALDLSVDREDGRNLSRGHSLRVFFNIPSHERASFETSLDRMDVSQAQAIVFKIKAEREPAGGSMEKTALYLTLRDGRHRQGTKEVRNAFSGRMGEWKTVIMLLDAFEEVDFDQLKSLRFTLIPGDGPAHGSLWVDEIAFWGPGNVAFESAKDNFVGFPEIVVATERRRQLLAEENDERFLRMIAEDTWRYFEEAKDSGTFLVADHIRPGEAPLIADYTSTTNIAMDLMGAVVAMDLEFISRERAVSHVERILSSLEELPRHEGFFYNFYGIREGEITRDYISSVDSGWLAIGLVVIRQAFPEEFGERATSFLDDFDFSVFLDPENNQMVIGFDVPVRHFGGYHYGLFVTEARATSFYAIGKGDVPREHWWFLYRTVPEAWDWQNQEPQGRFVTQEGVEYFQGYYERDGQKFVPSWGGSLFEVLMPALVLKEREMAPEGLGLNNRVTTELHRDYCLKERGYPVWGLSPCSTASGRQWAYREYGATPLGTKGYPDRGIVTPHVSFLALDSLPEAALENIRNLLEQYEGIYGEYGFYDSVDVQRDAVNPQYLALDQGMSLVAIGNYLTGGAIQERFHADPVGKAAEDLLGMERFFDE